MLERRVKEMEGAEFGTDVVAELLERNLSKITSNFKYAHFRKNVTVWRPETGFVFPSKYQMARINFYRLEIAVPYRKSYFKISIIVTCVTII